MLLSGDLKLMLLFTLLGLITSAHAREPDLMRQWNRFEKALSGNRACISADLKLTKSEFGGLESLPATPDETWVWLQNLAKEDPFHPEFAGNEDWVTEMQLDSLKRNKNPPPFSISYTDGSGCLVHLSGTYEHYVTDGTPHARIKSLSSIRIGKKFVSGTCDPCLTTQSGKYQIFDSYESEPLLSKDPLPVSVFRKLESIKNQPGLCK